MCVDCEHHQQQHSEKKRTAENSVWNSHGQRSHVAMIVPEAVFSAVRIQFEVISAFGPLHIILCHIKDNATSIRRRQQHRIYSCVEYFPCHGATPCTLKSTGIWNLCRSPSVVRFNGCVTLNNEQSVPRRATKITNRGFSSNMQISCFRLAKKCKQLLCIDIVICKN